MVKFTETELVNFFRQEPEGDPNPPTKLAANMSMSETIWYLLFNIKKVKLLGRDR